MAEPNIGSRDRLVRALLAAPLIIIAISTLRKGKRKTGLLVFVGALGFGFNVTTCLCGMNKTLGIDTTDEYDSTPEYLIGVLTNSVSKLPASRRFVERPP